MVSLGLSACGDDSGEEPTGRVAVAQVFRPEQRYLAEGAISTAIIESDGAELLRREVAQAGTSRPQTLLDKRLEPGTYRVTSYQRTCAPSSCQTLDPPSARCSAGFQVVDHKPVDVLITVNPKSRSCKIKTGFVELS